MQHPWVTRTVAVPLGLCLVGLSPSMVSAGLTWRKLGEHAFLTERFVRLRATRHGWGGFDVSGVGRRKAGVMEAQLSLPEVVNLNVTHAMASAVRIKVLALSEVRWLGDGYTGHGEWNYVKRSRCAAGQLAGTEDEPVMDLLRTCYEVSRALGFGSTKCCRLGTSIPHSQARKATIVHCPWATTRGRASSA